jgi:uncharacterized protein (TIGR03435 family)
MRGIVVCLLMSCSACGALAQEFEVVSVKPDTSGANSSSTNTNQGRLTATNVSLRSLIVMAYGIRDYQLEGPDWLASERYDLAAKFPEALPKDRDKRNAALGAMMQKMLADRFKLAIHRDQKQFAVYGLTVGKKGIKFKEVPGGGSSSSSNNNNHYVGKAISMSQFAEFLARRMDLPVLDMTGLTAVYDLTLDWVPEPRQSSESKAPAGDSLSGPALPEAIQEQLGLKFEARKAPLELVVVDHTEKVPTEN